MSPSSHAAARRTMPSSSFITKAMMALLSSRYFTLLPKDAIRLRAVDAPRRRGRAWFRPTWCACQCSTAPPARERSRNRSDSTQCAWGGWPSRGEGSLARFPTQERVAAAFSTHRAQPGRVTAKIREIGSRPGGQLPPDAAILRHLRTIDSHLGIRAQLDCASTDANVPLSLGIPAVSIGAGGQGGGAHTPGEWFHPEGRELGLRRIFLVLCLLMRDLHPAAAAGGQEPS